MGLLLPPRSLQVRSRAASCNTHGKQIPTGAAMGRRFRGCAVALLSFPEAGSCVSPRRSLPSRPLPGVCCLPRPFPNCWVLQRPMLGMGGMWMRLPGLRQGCR